MHLVNNTSYTEHGEGNGTPLQYSCLENPTDGGAWWAAVHGVAQSRIRLKRLSSSILSILVLNMYLFFLCLTVKFWLIIKALNSHMDCPSSTFSQYHVNLKTDICMD